MHHHILARFNEETHHILPAFGYEAFHLLGRHGQGVAHLHTGGSIILEVLYLSPLGIEFLGGIKSDVCLSSIQQLLHISLVDVSALALAIGAVLAAYTHTFIESDSQPLEGFNNIFFRAWHKTCGIGVLNAQYQLAIMLACKQIVVQCRTDSPNVERTRRTWCKTHPYFSLIHLFRVIYAQKYDIFF